MLVIMPCNRSSVLTVLICRLSQGLFLLGEGSFCQTCSPVISLLPTPTSPVMMDQQHTLLVKNVNYLSSLPPLSSPSFFPLSWPLSPHYFHPLLQVKTLSFTSLYVSHSQQSLSVSLEHLEHVYGEGTGDGIAAVILAANQEILTIARMSESRVRSK